MDALGIIQKLIFVKVVIDIQLTQKLSMKHLTMRIRMDDLLKIIFTITGIIIVAILIGIFVGTITSVARFVGGI